MTGDGDVIDLDRYEWERVVRRCVLPPTTKAVAAFLSQYANRDGSKIYPGVARLAAVSGFSERSVRAALSTLRELQLITRTRKGSSLGRQALTDEHKLTRPVDLIDRVHMLDVDESPESAACDGSCTHAGSPEPPAAVRAVPTKEHRQLTTRTPATGAGTPAANDRNTGRSCTPPTHDPPKYQTKDQRDHPVPEVTTGGDVLAQLIEIDRAAARRGA